MPSPALGSISAQVAAPLAQSASLVHIRTLCPVQPDNPSRFHRSPPARSRLRLPKQLRQAQSTCPSLAAEPNQHSAASRAFLQLQRRIMAAHGPHESPVVHGGSASPTLIARLNRTATRSTDHGGSIDMPLIFLA